jgi:hypothetical protein
MQVNMGRNRAAHRKKKAILFFFLALLVFFLGFTANTGASEIRRIGLADPWLIIMDSDTDWTYNPAYLIDTPAQAYSQYIYGGFGELKRRTEYGSPGSPSLMDSEGDKNSHTGELGLITAMNKGKLGFTANYKQVKTELDGDFISGGSTLNLLEYPARKNEDILFQAVYAFSLESDITLGISFLWDRKKDKVEYVYQDNPPTYQDYLCELTEYDYWDFTLGISWQQSPRWKVGLATGVGGYPGDYKHLNQNRIAGTSDSGEGDYKGDYAHFLAHLQYLANENMTVPIILRLKWNQQKRDASVSGNYLGAYLYDDEQETLDLTLGVGVNYLINKEASFLAGAGLYYTYTDWEEDYLHTAYYALFQEEKTHKIELRAGAERKILPKITGRTGLYYSYSLYDRKRIRQSNPSSGSDYYNSGDGWSQNAGIGLGLSSSLNERLRVDFGLDVPLIKEDHHGLTGNYANGNPYIRNFDEDDILYRIGFRITYLFP